MAASSRIKIAMNPIYITVRNLNSAVSGKSVLAMLGMLPALKKNPTVGLGTVECLARPAPFQRLRLHHAYMKHVVDSINRLCSEEAPSEQESGASIDSYEQDCTLLRDRNFKVVCETGIRYPSYSDEVMYCREQMLSRMSISPMHIV